MKSCIKELVLTLETLNILDILSILMVSDEDDALMKLVEDIFEIS